VSYGQAEAYARGQWPRCHGIFRSYAQWYGRARVHRKYDHVDGDGARRDTLAATATVSRLSATVVLCGGISKNSEVIGIGIGIVVSVDIDIASVDSGWW
jgi:hypothetical protein